MPLTALLPLLPADAHEVGDSLAILRDEREKRIVFFNAGGPIFSCRQEDRTGLRLAAVTVVEQGLAGPTAVAEALAIHRTTLLRDRHKFLENGVAGLVEKRRGPKGPHTLTPAVQRRAQKMLDRGESIRGTAGTVGMSESGLRHAIARGLLTAGRSKRVEKAKAKSAQTLTGPRDRASTDQACKAGVATKRELDRTLASMGKLVEAEPEFEPVEGVAGAGVLLALPALLHEGLCEVGTDVYGKLRNGYFGLRSVLLTFAFMALLRIKTTEQLTEHAPGELGILLGLDRAPEVKTLRRKLREMGQCQLADMFKRRLTERWAKAAPRELALLYVDGHVRPYHGRKHVLPKHHVQQRGRPMPGTKDFHVNDRRADPLFFVTAEATEGLLAMLDTTLLPEVRSLVGPRRRVTIAFDREGWSPGLFAKWKEQDFDVLTYRKGKQSRWQNRFFTTVKGTVGGEQVEYRLAEREAKLLNGLKVREIRRLTDDGHQTAVITTNEKLPSARGGPPDVFALAPGELLPLHAARVCARSPVHPPGREPPTRNVLVPHPERARLEKEAAEPRGPPGRDSWSAPWSSPPARRSESTSAGSLKSNSINSSDSARPKLASWPRASQSYPSACPSRTSWSPIKSFDSSGNGSAGFQRVRQLPRALGPP